MSVTEKTLEFYNEKAEEFVQGTLNVDFSAIQNEFISMMQDGGTILDLGTGSGRDAKAFLEHGFRVVAVDGSVELAKLASDYIGQEVIVSSFQEYKPDQMFDGIWACASLLHLSMADIERVVSRLARSLNVGACFYASFKYGDFSGERNGRFFTDMTEERFTELMKGIPKLGIQKFFVTEDVRPGREAEKWLNVLMVRR